MLNKLTKEQKDLKSEVKNEWINKLTESTKIDEKALLRGIKLCYSKLTNKSPKVFICNDPLSAVKLCHKLGNKKVKTIHYFGLGYDSGWLSFYDYFLRLGIVKSKLFKQYLDFINCGAFGYIFLENAAIAIKRPLYVKRDNNKRMHSYNTPSVEFEGGGYKSYRWHGVKVPKQLIENPESITKKFIENEKNSEVQRAIAEKLGWNKYLELVDVKLIDKWFDVNTSCHYELYDFKNRSGSLQPKLLKMESPELHDGTRPYYIEPVPPESMTCQAARRWQCDPSRPSINKCNINPSLEFEHER